MSINITTESYPVDLSVTEKTIKLTISNLIYQANGVASINSQTGNVVLTANDVGAEQAGAANAAVDALQPQIDTLTLTTIAQATSIATKADQDTVDAEFVAVNSAIDTGLTAANQAINTKASQIDLNALDARVVNNSTAIGTKADAVETSQALATKATLTALNQVKSLSESNQLNISSKVDQVDFDALSINVVNNAQTLLTKADIATLTTLAQLVDTKADQSYVVSEIARITGNAPAALDTLAEIAEQLGNDQTQINNLLNQIGSRVRFDAAQSLTAPQQTQARDNINAEAKGVAASLVSNVTTTSIGAATAAQGAKADTALQSGDVAPVALSGSFSDLVNKSSLFSLVYSAYAIGSNVAISASDTLGQMLGKLQAQINSNVTAISTKEPNIVLGNTTQYLRGDKTWRDLSTDVRGTVLTGLSTATNSAISATDNVLVALGKAQAQISNNFAIATPVLRKIGASWYVPARWYDCVYPSPGSLSTITPNIGVQYYIDFQALENTTLINLGVNVAAAGTNSAFQLGIYSSDVNNEPAALLFKSSPLDATTTGAKTAACSVVVVSGQVYYISFLLLSGSGAAFTANLGSTLRAIKGGTSLTTASTTLTYSTSISDMPSTPAAARVESPGNTFPRVCFAV